ncbi:hypothetical protein [Hymenobacter duratus]|uniref:hypothetical protein n=1 Tax=Hymenobacter duratus TaxID=2771356 RepID=UPI003743C84F
MSSWGTVTAGVLSRVSRGGVMVAAGMNGRADDGAQALVTCSHNGPFGRSVTSGSVPGASGAVG